VNDAETPSVGAITMLIAEAQRSKAFYEQVFDAKAVYKDEEAVAFEFENMVANLLRVRAAHELIALAPVGDADGDIWAVAAKIPS
jgi:hypothetical protein